MNNVSVSAWVKATDGPDLSTIVDVAPETVAQASVLLDEAAW